MKYSYIVWVGGVADYEGNNFSRAYSIYEDWIAQGYDDVIIEKIGV
jgi:hypothetical protein